MSQIQITKIICSNSTCDNILSEYEIKRLTHRWNRFRLCPTCRRGHKRLSITTMDCARCGKSFTNNDSTLYCKTCQKKRTNERQLERYHKNKKPSQRNKVVDKVLNILKTHDGITIKEIAKILGISPHSIRTHIYNLRHRYGYTIEVRYQKGYKLK